MVFENIIKKGLTSVKFGRSVKGGQKPRKAFGFGSNIVGDLRESNSGGIITLRG